MLAALLSDLRSGVQPPILSARFHNTLAQLIHRVCQQVRAQSGTQEVALSGGVWQNMVLLKKTVIELPKEGFSVKVHREVPTNDGGIALGQAVVAMHFLDS